MSMVLNLLPDGRGVLTTDHELSQREAHELREAWKRWADSKDGIAIIGNCRVNRIDSIALDLKDGELVPA